MTLMPDLQNYPSHFELSHLAYNSMMDDEILWLVSNLCAYVYNQKKQKSHYQCGQSQKPIDGPLHYKSEAPKCTCSHSILNIFII